MMKNIVAIVSLIVLSGCVPQQQVDYSAMRASDQAHYTCGTEKKIKEGTQKYVDCYQGTYKTLYALYAASYAQQPTYRPAYQPAYQPYYAPPVRSQRAPRNVNCQTYPVGSQTLQTTCY